VRRSIAIGMESNNKVVDKKSDIMSQTGVNENNETLFVKKFPWKGTDMIVESVELTEKCKKSVAAEHEMSSKRLLEADIELEMSKEEIKVGDLSGLENRNSSVEKKGYDSKVSWARFEGFLVCTDKAK